MTLTNKRVQFTVEETGEHLKLHGEVIMNVEQNTFTVSGSFNQLTGEHIGGFYYNEQNGQVIDKNFNSIQKSFYTEALSVLDSVIAAIPSALQND